MIPVDNFPTEYPQLILGLQVPGNLDTENRQHIILEGRKATERLWLHAEVLMGVVCNMYTYVTEVRTASLCIYYNIPQSHQKDREQRLGKFLGHSHKSGIYITLVGKSES